MTVIAYDGSTLAADKMAICAGARLTVTKVFRRQGFRIGISGTESHGLAVAAWIEAHGKPDDYPKAEKDDLSYCLVVFGDGRVLRYEGTAYPIESEDRFAAAGSGQDFALAAMYLGHDAVEAVRVASALSSSCGGGIDVLKGAGHDPR